MHKLSLFLGFLGLSLGLNATHLSIGSFNLRRAGKELKAERRWENRVSRINQFLHVTKPTIIGFQEATQCQIADLNATLKDYGWFGTGRGSSLFGMAADEAVPLFYNKKIVNLIESGTFSIKPDKFWYSEKGLIPRICSWGLFQVKETGYRFYVFNTHLDHQYDKARINQLNVLMGAMQKVVKEPDLPIFLMGDFNTDLTPAILQVIPHFENTRAKADAVAGPSLTHASWGSGKISRIDHILVKNGQNMRINRFITVAEGDRPAMSDHRPILVYFEI